MRYKHASVLLINAALSAGCATVTVTKVTQNNMDTVKGVRYSLPKPFIQVIPQSDDTILVNVIMLPDMGNTYAIETSSTLSTYSFQVAINQNGTLSAVEFKHDNTAVAQQAAASAGTASTQLFNMRIANALATQGAVNTAQAAVDSAQSAYDVAAAQLAADKANGATTTTLNTDAATVQVKLAALTDAKSVLSRTKSSGQIGQYSASPSTPLASSGPTPTTGTASGFGAQTWTAPVEYELPEQYGAVLYAVNESDNGKGARHLSLDAVQLNGKEQPEFPTTKLAASPPVLVSSNPIKAGTATIALQFTEPVTSVDQCDVFTTAAVPVKVTGNGKCAFKDPASDRRSVTLTLPTPALPPGNYSITVGYSWQRSANAGAASFSTRTFLTIQ